MRPVAQPEQHARQDEFADEKIATPMMMPAAVNPGA
jgi:hypothetical protein